MMRAVVGKNRLAGAISAARSSFELTGKSNPVPLWPTRIWCIVGLGTAATLQKEQYL